MIYFIQDPRDFAIKIGTSAIVSRRLRQLEAEFGYPLVLLGVRAGSYLLERIFHSRFDQCRIKRSEWFTPSPELLAYIRGHCHAWSPADDQADSEYDREMSFVLSGEGLLWIEGFGKSMDLSICELIDKSLDLFAQDQCYTDPAPGSREQRNRDNPPLEAALPATSDPVSPDEAAPVEDHVSEWAWV